MQTLLNRLAANLGQGPFIADAQGKYHLRIDGYPLFLAPRNGELLLSTPLASSQRNDAEAHDPALLKRLLQQVVAWGRHAPMPWCWMILAICSWRRGSRWSGSMRRCWRSA